MATALKKLNDLTTTIAPRLLESNLALHIVHICGPAHEAAIRVVYTDSLPAVEAKRVTVLGVTSDFGKYAAAADIILGRAGATSLAEFELLGKACIIIPSPFLAGGHQLKNAEELKDSDAAVIMDEEASPDELLVMISELLNNAERRRELARNLAKLAKPEAAKRLAELIIKIGSKEQA